MNNNITVTHFSVAIQSLRSTDLNERTKQGNFTECSSHLLKVLHKVTVEQGSGTFLAKVAMKSTYF